jgi:hypothetical protein
MIGPTEPLLLPPWSWYSRSYSSHSPRARWCFCHATSTSTLTHDRRLPDPRCFLRLHRRDYRPKCSSSSSCCCCCRPTDLRRCHRQLLLRPWVRDPLQQAVTTTRRCRPEAAVRRSSPSSELPFPSSGKRILSRKEVELVQEYVPF